MRVPPTAIQPLVRDYGKPAAGRGHAETNAATGPHAPAAANTASPASDSSSTKTTPPGLERVLERLQNLPAPNAGQTNALDRISRNIARYRETQALVKPLVTAPEPASGADTSASTLTDAPATGNTLA